MGRQVRHGRPVGMPDSETEVTTRFAELVIHGPPAFFRQVEGADIRHRTGCPPLPRLPGTARSQEVNPPPNGNSMHFGVTKCN